MRLPALIAATLALSLSAACAPSAPPTDAPPQAASGDAAAAQRTWEARRPAAYAYTLEVSCFCLHRGQFAIEVRDGRISSARDAASGAPAAESAVQWLVTVERLFESIREASLAGTPVRAVYHPELGYPTEAEIGLLANDSGTLYRITNLRPL